MKMKHIDEVLMEFEEMIEEAKQEGEDFFSCEVYRSEDWDGEKGVLFFLHDPYDPKSGAFKAWVRSKKDGYSEQKFLDLRDALRWLLP
jgi:hypothetical protein